MRIATRALAAASISALIAGLAWTPIASGSSTEPSEGTAVGGSEAATTTAPAPAGADAGCDIEGTTGDDELHSTSAGQVICGLAGDDEIWGAEGRDVLKGGPGEDNLHGGAHDDDLFGGIGEDDTCQQGDGTGKKSGCEWPNPFLTCPVAKGETVYDDFGDDRGDHAHQGNDITAKKGTRVLATFRGKISNHHAEGAGKYVQLTRADGAFTYGMHLARFSKERRVRAGDVIGFVGSTGNAYNNNHLHFEWHPTGKDAVDPFKYLSQLCNDVKDAPAAAGPEFDWGVPG